MGKCYLTKSLNKQQKNEQQAPVAKQREITLYFVSAIDYGYIGRVILHAGTLPLYRIVFLFLIDNNDVFHPPRW